MEYHFTTVSKRTFTEALNIYKRKGSVNKCYSYLFQEVYQVTAFLQWILIFLGLMTPGTLYGYVQWMWAMASK
jgi:hypothetical protein